VQYRKCGPNELVALLNSLARLCAKARQGLPLCSGLQSSLLKSLMSGFPDLSEVLQGWLDAINCAVASTANPDKCSLLVGFDDPSQYKEISEIKAEISQVRGQRSSRPSVTYSLCPTRTLLHPFIRIACVMDDNMSQHYLSGPSKYCHNQDQST
jgi:hypothetical protein